MAKPSAHLKPKKKSGGDNSSSALWTVVIVACLGVVAAAFYFAGSATDSSRIDEATLCHSSGPTSIKVVLLDLTDPLSKTQQSRLGNILAAEIEVSGIDTMIAVGVVSEAESNWGVRFAKCKPATGAEANSLYENPRLIREKYTSEFSVPLQATLGKLIDVEAENTSPIMEALQSLIAEAPDFSSATGARKIIVVSDMLQNSETLSFYRGEDWDFFVRQSGDGRLAENLADVDIEIVRIPRSGGRTPAWTVAEGFWVRYFDRQGSNPPMMQSLGDL